MGHRDQLKENITLLITYFLKQIFPNGKILWIWTLTGTSQLALVGSNPFANLRDVRDTGLNCLPAKLFQSCLTLYDHMDLACWAPLSMGFSRQEYCSGLSRPSPRAVPNSGTEPATLYVFCIGKQVLYHQSQKTSRGKTWLNGQLGWTRKGRMR